MKSLELLAPAGSLETLKAVICAGADAVYLGGNLFGARAYADNFTEEELIEGIHYAHLHGRRVFLTVNTLLKNRELEEKLYDYLLPYYEEGLDAVIVQDMGVLSFIREMFPNLPIHTSTQMTITNADGARLMKSMGAERVVTARELSCAEIRCIHEEAGVEIESFIHGALCYCYSGQCLLSSMLGGRSGNRGRCAQPCRLPYTVYDGAGNEISDKNIPILSLKDLCTLPFLYELADNGVYSFKIEGRMKSPEYAAGVVSIYRKYMDSYLEDSRIPVDKKDMQSLMELGSRNGFTDGYYFNHNDSSMLSGATANHSRRDGAFQEEIRAKYVEGEIKEKINGNLKFYKDKTAMLMVDYGNYHISCEGPLVMPALKQPLSRKTVEEKMRKTGGTPFVFDKLAVEMEADVFLPVNQLNQLRREALHELEEAILAPYRRTAGTYGSSADNGITANAAVRTMHMVSVEEARQLTVVLSYDFVDGIYLESLMYDSQLFIEQLSEDVAKIHAAGKRAYYAFPAVFRKRTLDYYEKQAEVLKEIVFDGYLIRSLDELGFLQRHHMTNREIVSDSNLYTYSDRAAGWYYRQGITRDTVPVELNQKEIAGRQCEASEMIVYGRLPLMITAQCVRKNTLGCDKKPCVTELKDRYQVHFPVRNHCMECYNILYNSKPLCLLREAPKLKRLAPAAYRMNFTVEDETGVKAVMDVYKKAIIVEESVCEDEYPADYTNGHFKRGVE